MRWFVFITWWDRSIPGCLHTVPVVHCMQSVRPCMQELRPQEHRLLDLADPTGLTAAGLFRRWCWCHCVRLRRLQAAAPTPALQQALQPAKGMYGRWPKDCIFTVETCLACMPVYSGWFGYISVLLGLRGWLSIFHLNQSLNSLMCAVCRLSACCRCAAPPTLRRPRPAIPAASDFGCFSLVQHTSPCAPPMFAA